MWLSCSCASLIDTFWVVINIVPDRCTINFLKIIDSFTHQSLRPWPGETIRLIRPRKKTVSVML